MRVITGEKTGTFLEELIVLEMYLFINPLGGMCYRAEQNILNLLESATEEVRFRFIPLLNMQSTQDVMKLNHLPLNDLAARNRLVNDVYRASLDFKAALFQGKKRGRSYLLNVQKQMMQFKGQYSDEVAFRAAAACGLDQEMFEHDRRSDFAAHSFLQDQKMAAEMKVTHHPTVVLYNVSGYDCGIAMDACNSYSILKEVFAGNIPHGLVEQECNCHSKVSSLLSSKRIPLKINIDNSN